MKEIIFYNFYLSYQYFDVMKMIFMKNDDFFIIYFDNIFNFKNVNIFISYRMAKS